MISKRQFIQQAGGMAAAVLALPAWAQGKPVEGQHYKRLQTAQPVASDKGEVLEFFWYGCPHCYRFEPALHQWLARKPGSVSFKRSPAIIHGASKAHQRLFFTLQAMGLSESLHGAVFAAVQADPAGMGDVSDMQAMLGKHGVDTAKFAQLYQSFSVLTRCQQADTLIRSYLGDGYTVPTLAVNGRYITSPHMAGSEAQAIAVLEHLLTLPR